VVYLTRTPAGSIGRGSTMIFRGRLHQALDASWIFNTSTSPAENGVAGINLGAQQTSWSSTESPSTGLDIFIPNPILDLTIPLPVGPGVVIKVFEEIHLLSVIPEDLTN
jgi:hypothetical protein